MQIDKKAPRQPGRFFCLAVYLELVLFIWRNGQALALRSARVFFAVVCLNALGFTSLGLTSLSFMTEDAQAQSLGTVRAEYGVWKLRCDSVPGAREEQCGLTQFVTAEDRQNVGLSLIVVRTADKQSVKLRILAPLGVFLPTGLGLRIDGEDMGRAGFVRCIPNGCYAEVTLNDEIIGKLQNGTEALFVINQIPEEGIGIPIALDGFAEGFEALP